MATPSDNSWRYHRSASFTGEVGYWDGASAPALCSHFHREAQYTFVLSGSRRFQVRGMSLQVNAGQCLVIPPGLPHRSLPHVHVGTACINVYVPAPAAMQWARVLTSQDFTGMNWHDSIAKIAKHAGMSREDYTRRFSQRVGMPPHAYRMVDRLNDARERLQCGAAIADLAFELGFSDQSHFGRHFRRAFGVSPRVYRDSVLESQTF